MYTSDYFEESKLLEEEKATITEYSKLLKENNLNQIK